MLDSRINQNFNRPITSPQFRASQSASTPVELEEKKGLSSGVKWTIGVGLTALASYGIYYVLTKGRVKVPKPTPKPENPIPEIKEMAIDEFKKLGIFDNGKALLKAKSGSYTKKYTGNIINECKDGSRVIMEYTRGVLQKSTKTAKDGSKIFEKIYELNDNNEKIVRIIKGDQTKIINLTETIKAVKKQQKVLKDLLSDNELISSENFKKSIDEIQYKSISQQEIINTILHNKQLEENLLDKTIRNLSVLRSNVNSLSRHELEKLRCELGSYSGQIQILIEKGEKSGLTFNEKLILERLKEQLKIVKNREAEIEKSLEKFVPSIKGYCELSNHHDLAGHNCIIRDYLEGNVNGSNGSRPIDRDEQEFLKKLIKDIDDEFMCLEPLEKDCIVYRGRTENTLFSSLNKDFDVVNSANVGDVIVPDKGYSYTAFHRSLAECWGGVNKSIKADGSCVKTIMYEIRLPKGARVSRNLEHGGEVVMPRGAQYKMIDKKVNDDGCIEVVLEYILPKVSL